jgi:HD-GYP domain-containing protein (c-di-GMP phosphodiesterase class II)/DNA-binding CsgD family transcriptional regulator
VRGAGDGVRLAELVAALSLATDLGLGQPQQHIIRQTLIALRVADLQGLSDDERAAIFYVSLLAWVGCVADAHEMGKWFGDDTAIHADSYLVDMTGLPMVRFMLGHVAGGSSPIRRFTMIGRFLAGGSKEVAMAMASHCETSGDLSLRLGLGPEVRDPLQQAFERWDGKGSPAKLAGPEIAGIMRIVHVANDVEALYRIGGVDAAVEMLRSRRGTEFDPDLVDLFCAHADELLASIEELDGWDTLIGGRAELGSELSEADLDRAFEAFADYADVKSPFLLGRSRGVADLAAAAAAVVGLPNDDIVLVRRAGLVHDVGTIGVPAGILEKTGRLTETERERIRTHPYLTARTFSKPPALAAIGQLAAKHHERMDGSGYPSGLTGESLPMAARVIAAADVYHALLEARPHRAAFARDQARQVLLTEVTEGRLDGEAVRAVLDAAGHPLRRKVGHPGGLTAREVEVLVLLSRGMTRKQIAQELTISAKTVGNHEEHIYSKLGVRSRGAASLFAMRHGLTSMDAAAD